MGIMNFFRSKNKASKHSDSHEIKSFLCFPGDNREGIDSSFSGMIDRLIEGYPISIHASLAEAKQAAEGGSENEATIYYLGYSQPESKQLIKQGHFSKIAVKANTLYNIKQGWDKGFIHNENFDADLAKEISSCNLL